MQNINVEVYDPEQVGRYLVLKLAVDDVWYAILPGEYIVSKVTITELTTGTIVLSEPTDFGITRIDNRYAYDTVRFIEKI